MHIESERIEWLTGNMFTENIPEHSVAKHYRQHRR